MNEPIDMSQFIEARSDQLNADDLIGRTLTVTVTKVTGSEGDQPISIFYQGDNGKPFKPCKTIRRVLTAIWGRYANDYVGRSMTLYRDDKVTFGGLEVGGIRISHMSHLDKETVVVVAKSKGKKAGMKILPLAAGKPSTDNAQTWATGYIKLLAEKQTLDLLNEFANSKAKKLAELETARPELHKQCIEALDARRASLSTGGNWDDDPSDGTLSDDNPSAAEGPADEQRGENTDDDWGNADTPAWQQAVDNVGDLIAAATDQKSWKAADEAFQKISAGLPDDVAASVKLALETKRAALMKG